MNSFNHYAYGAVGEWLYRYVAGIDEDPGYPGFQHILLHPQFDATLGDASATYQSPSEKAAAILEGGKSLNQTSTPRFKSNGNGSSSYEVGFGTYSFTIQR